MTRTILAWSLAIGCAITAAATPASQDGTRPARPADTDKTFSDSTFVLKATAAGLAEVNISTLVSTRATDAAVKKFAAQMVTDHTKANQELLSLANALSIKAGTSMDAEHQALFKKLGKMKGPELDRAYISGQVKDHEDAIGLYEKQSKNGKDEKLTAWAKKTLPTLRMHLKMAQEVQKNLKGGTTAGTTTDKGTSDR